MDNLNATPPNVGEIDFEDLRLYPESSWKGTSGTSGFVSGNVVLNNNYDAGWDSWDGFAFSNLTDTVTIGFAGQFSAVAGMGCRGSSNYAVAYYSAWAADPPTITLPKAHQVAGAYIVNNNYACYSMLNGDQFAKQFTESDWFKLTVTGKDENGTQTGTVDFLLADGTELVDFWTWVDLSSLGKVKTLEFLLSSSDTSAWGMNTPAYFCIDNLTLYFDANDNGIPDDQEDSTVDLDEDGTPDINQAEFKCVKSAVDDQQAIGVSVAGAANVTGIRSIRAIDPAKIFVDANRPNAFPAGLIDYELTVNPPGASVEATVYCSFAAPKNAKWYTYTEKDGWQDYSDYVTWEPGRRALRIRLKDGGHGDADGKANGVIHDPSGVGVVATSGDSSAGSVSSGGNDSSDSGGEGNADVVSGGGGGGGCFISTLTTDW
jgi:hypothetical protein